MASDGDRIESLLDRAAELASDRNHEYITLEHLLLSLLQEPLIGKILAEVKTDVTALKVDVANHLDQNMNDIARDGSKPRKTQALSICS